MTVIIDGALGIFGAGVGAQSWQPVQTSSFTAVAANAYPVNTTAGPITVTLPASPSAGNIVQLTDYAGTWGTNFVTVNGNGSNISGLSTSLSLVKKRESVALVYIDSTQGWIVYSIGSVLPYQVSYLIVAGGGSGGASSTASSGGGGGGGGGVLTGSVGLDLGTTYSITVGAGGASLTGSPYYGNSGSNSSAFGLNAIGGGGGGGTSGAIVAGRSGGSGGGAANYLGTGTAGSGTVGQGNTGGAISGTQGSPNYPSAGGGGASATGGNVTSTTVGGTGGAGLASTITGSSVTYAGGGGGATYNGGTPGAGGAGGGGGSGRPQLQQQQELQQQRRRRGDTAGAAGRAANRHLLGLILPKGTTTRRLTRHARSTQKAELALQPGGETEARTFRDRDVLGESPFAA